MYKYSLHIFIIVLLFATYACDNRHSAILDKAETLFVENSDSAIALLNQIEQKELQNRNDATRYVLLQTLLHDNENNIMFTEETMRNVALFFEKKGDEKNHFLSLYSLGHIFQKKGHASKAMLLYTQAEQHLDKVNTPIYVAFLYSRIAQLYRESYDFGKALKYLEMAHLHYKLAGSATLEHNTLVQIAQTLIEMKHYSEAERYLLEELQWGYEKGDKNICQNTIENLLMLYDRTDYPAKSNWLLSSEYFSMCDTTLIVDRTLAYMYAMENDIRTSNRYMRRAWKKATSINDTLNNLMQMYDISKLSGNYNDALMILENVHYIHDTIMRSALQQPMVSAQRDFYQSQSELHEYKLAETNRIIIFAVVAVLLLLCIIALISKNRMAAKNAEIERYMELADEMSKSLHAKTVEYDDISSRLENHTAQIATMEQQVGVLFKKQFEMLDELSNTFYETHEIKKDKEAIYRQVRKNIESLMNDKKSVEQLEEIVNSYRNGIVNKLRNEMPQLGDSELRFLIFLYAGFSAKAISIFTQDSVGNVYTKKSRIKSVISRSDAKNKQLFLDAMN